MIKKKRKLKNGVDYFCFSVKGKVLTKKRARTQGSRHWTPDNWYEKMARDAFQRLYPDHKPIGHEYYDKTIRNYKGKPKEYYRLNKNYSVSDLPSIRLFIFVYINEGMVGDDDNYVKVVLDALNKTLYMDDKMVRTPTPYVIVDPYEEERLDIIAIKYDQKKDKTLKKFQNFISKHAKEIDIQDDYELVKLKEMSIPKIYNTLCYPKDCPYFQECNFRRKDDIINCEFRKSL